jgi:hypothetical protein
MHIGEVMKLVLLALSVFQFGCDAGGRASGNKRDRATSRSSLDSVRLVYVADSLAKAHGANRQLDSVFSGWMQRYTDTPSTLAFQDVVGKQTGLSVIRAAITDAHVEADSMVVVLEKQDILGPGFRLTVTCPLSVRSTIPEFFSVVERIAWTNQRTFVVASNLRASAVVLVSQEPPSDSEPPSVVDEHRLYQLSGDCHGLLKEPLPPETPKS